MTELRMWRRKRWLSGMLLGVIGGLLAEAPLPAEGAGAPNRERKSDRLIVLGGGGGGDTLYGYAGVIIPLNGEINGQGYVVRGWAKTFNFDYQTTIAGKAGTTVNATGYGLAGEFGYQWIFAGHGRIAVYGGIRYRDFTLAPNDPGSDLEDDDVGASVTIDGRWHLSETFAVSANASFTAGFDEYWLQLKPHIVLANGARLGPDLVVQGGDNYRFLRFGAVISDITVHVPSLGRLFLTVEAGLLHDDKDGSDDFQAGIHSAFFY